MNSIAPIACPAGTYGNMVELEMPHNGTCNDVVMVGGVA